MSSPTKRTLDVLRERGYMAGVVERWNHAAKVRQDLFGIVDVIGVRPNETVAVQATSASNVAARVKKIAASPALGELRAAGWRVLVHGWAKRDGRWQVREVDMGSGGMQ